MDDGNANKLKIVALVSSMGCLPLFFILFVVFIVVFLVLGLLDGGDGTGSSCVNIKSADEICTSITVAGYGTMSVDEYVAGVVENEYGGAAYEMKKALAVAARSFGIHGAEKDGNGNCSVGDTSEGFQTYNPNPNETSVQAANETSGMILVDENGNVVSSQYSSCSLQKPYNESGNIIKMSERDYEMSRDMFDKYRVGTACTDGVINKLKVGSNGKAWEDWAGRPFYGSGHGRGMGQVLGNYLASEKDYTYDQILDFFYGSESTYNWSLASTKGASSNCTSTHNGNFQTLSTYNIGHDGLKILNHSLSSSEIDNLNSYIEKEVDKAGYGTGEAVAAAGQSLAYGMEQMGYYLGYCWGGDRSSMGVGTSWGNSSSSCNSPTNSHKYFGMDCSGFVSWAIRNACKPGYSNTTHGMDHGPHIKAENAKPGDLMLNPASHVRLVVKNNGDGTVITVESGGSYDGIAFSKHGDESGYNFIDMSKWYRDNCD